MNLETVRVNEKARRNRYKQMSSDVLEDVATMNEGNDRNHGEEDGDFMTTSLQRLQDAVVTNGEDDAVVTNG